VCTHDLRKSAIRVRRWRGVSLGRLEEYYFESREVFAVYTRLINTQARVGVLSEVEVVANVHGKTSRSNSVETLKWHFAAKRGRGLREERKPQCS
jgi:hypothetical protein